MGLSLVSGPTTEPVTLGETKAHLRIDGADDDALIAGYILAARRYAEGYTRRAFVTQTWDYTIDRQWPYVQSDCYLVRRITLPLPPLQSVSSITYVDNDGNTQTLAADQYVVKTDDTSGVIEPAYNVTWPDVRWQLSAVTVRFVAGWTQIPDEIRTAIMLHVEILFDRNPNDRELLESARDCLLDPYRVIRIV
jgi:uncharacterized phiE125 gp8 family phage protein